ncbi:MAG: 3-keto-disaccharide hydrolase [Bacteroidota bacterium]
MNLISAVLSILLLTCTFSICAQTREARETRETRETKKAEDMRVRLLFNGKDLEGWDTYIGPPYDTIQKKFLGGPLGLNRDPHHVFSVVTEDGAPAIRVSGEHFGGLSTQEEFKNYHLTLEFKWGQQKWHPKRKAKRDSGLLYHAVGSHGADGGFWMRSQEFQIQESDCGDYWGVAGGIFDVHALKKSEKEYIYEPSGPLLTFKAGSAVGRRCIKNPDAEKTSGQWNKLDLYCSGDTSVHVVNDQIVMILFHSRQMNDNAEIPLTAGKIQLQSEGAELFYRAITVQPIDQLPKKILR